jgi:hypothetical protein
VIGMADDASNLEHASWWSRSTSGSRVLREISIVSDLDPPFASGRSRRTSVVIDQRLVARPPLATSRRVFAVTCSGAVWVVDPR